MLAELGSEFVLQEVRRERHRTPAGAEQAFIWFLLRWMPRGLHEGHKAASRQPRSGDRQ
jgi:hypothetical protein